MTLLTGRYRRLSSLLVGYLLLASLLAGSNGLFSRVAQAAGPQGLDLVGLPEGGRIAGVAVVEARTTTAIRRVEFRVTGPRSASHVEWVAPYYFMGDNAGKPKGWNTTGWPDGAYSMTARACDANNTCATLKRNFAIANKAAPTATPLPQPTANPTPNPTQLPAPQPEQLIWSGDHETGDFSQWEGANGYDGGFANTGTGEGTISSEVAHSGRYSAKLTIRDAASTKQAVRLFRWKEWNLSEGYYSAWYYFPQLYKPTQWWDVFQFKSRTETQNDPMWILNVANRTNGEMYFYLRDWPHQKSYTQTQMNIPVGRWFHVEVYYRRSTTNTGRVTVWQDGVQLWDLDGVQTAISDRVHWSLTNYTDGISPSTATIYIDDAVISKTRVGPGK